MVVRAQFVLLLISCTSAIRLPSHGVPRLVPLSRGISGGGCTHRCGPIACKTTDEEWARRWPNKTPEEIANMKKWCAAGPCSSTPAQEVGGACTHSCAGALLHGLLHAARTRRWSSAC